MDPRRVWRGFKYAGPPASPRPRVLDSARVSGGGAALPTTFRAYRETVRGALEERLARTVEGEDLGTLYRYAVQDGKRVRPTLTLLIAEALGGDREVALDLACSVELTHCASLALDDLLDGHPERRGRPTLPLAEGLRKAVTTGFTLPSVALNLAARHGAATAEALSEAWVAMCLGAYREAPAAALPWSEYLQVVELKTGRLFATACAFGAHASGQPTTGFGDYGLHLGNAFQLADDLADGAATALRPRLRRTVQVETTRAAKAADRWHDARPDLRALLRRAPEDLVAWKEGGA